MDLIRKVFEGKIFPKQEYNEEKNTITTIYVDFDGIKYDDEDTEMYHFAENFDMENIPYYIIFVHRERGRVFFSGITDGALCIGGISLDKENKKTKNFGAVYLWENIILEEEDEAYYYPKIVEIQKDYGKIEWVEDKNVKQAFLLEGYQPMEGDILQDGEMEKLPEDKRGYRIPVVKDLEYPFKTLDFALYYPMEIEQEVYEQLVEIDGEQEETYQVNVNKYHPMNVQEDEFYEPESINLHLNYFANYEGIADRIKELVKLKQKH